MSVLYSLWQINNVCFSGITYYITPLFMQLIEKYGYTVGLTLYQVIKADAMFPYTLSTWLR